MSTRPLSTVGPAAPVPGRNHPERAAEPAPVVQSTTETPWAPAPGRSTIDLTEVASQYVWRALIDSPVSLSKPFGTGSDTLTVSLDQSVKSPAQQSAHQDAFQAEQVKKGNAVAWVSTGGAMKGQAANDAGSLGGEFSFALERPFVHRPNALEVARLAQELAANNTTGLPLTASKARALEQGSRFVLRGSVNGAYSSDGATVDASANGKLGIEAAATWTGKDKVEATLTFHRQAATTGSATNAEHGAGWRASSERTHTVRVAIDLSTQRGQNAWAALMRLQPEALAHLAKGGDGVRLMQDTTTRASAGGGHLETTGTAGTARIEGSARNTTHADGSTTRERSGEVSVAPNVGPQGTLDLEAGGSSTVREFPDGRRTVSGTLTGRIDASVETAEGDRELSGRGSKTRSWTLDVPASARGQAVEPPLSSARARQLPPQSRFQLSLDSRASFEAGASAGAVDEPQASLTASGMRNRQVSLTVDRPAGADLVKVKVTQRGEVEHTQGGKLTHPEGGLGIGFERATRVVQSETGAIELDLSKADDQVIYDELVRGELSGLARRAPLEVAKFKNVKASVDFSLAPNPYVTAAAQLRREVYDDADWRSSDASRRKVSADAKARGSTVEWVEEKGVLELSGRVPKVPVDGPFSISFSAGQSLEYTVDRPRFDGQTQGSRLPPLEVADALAMPVGSRVTMAGTGKRQVGLAAGTATVGASVSVSGGVATERVVRTSAEFLGEGKVKVTVDDDAKDSLTSLRLVAQAGVVLPFESATSLAGKLLSKATGIDALDDPAIRLEAEASRATRTDRDLAITLDLKVPEEAEAYRELMLGNSTKALALKRGTASLQTETRDRARLGVSGLGVTVGASSERTSRARVQVADGNVAATNTELATKDSSFFAQRRAVKFEAVSRHQLGQLGDRTLEALAQTSEGKLDDTYFRLTASTSQAFTSTQRLNHTRALAAGLGLTPDGEVKVEEDNERGMSAMLGSLNRFGKTDSALDVLVSKRGVERVRERSETDAEAAYASFFTLATGRTPSWAGPDAAKAKEFLDTYLSAPNDETSSYKSWAAGQYYSTFKRRLTDDLEAYQGLVSFKKLHSRMQNNPDAREWSRAFADHGSEVGSDMFASVHAFNALAGADSVFVNAMTMSGRTVKLKWKPRTEASVHASLPPAPPPTVAAVVPPPAPVAAPSVPPRAQRTPPPALDVASFTSAGAVRRAAAQRASAVVLASVEDRLAFGGLDASATQQLRDSLASLGPPESLDKELRERFETVLKLLSA